MKQSHKAAGGRGPQFPGHIRSQTPKGRSYRSPWRRTSSHPPPVSRWGDKTDERRQRKVSAVTNERWNVRRGFLKKQDSKGARKHLIQTLRVGGWWKSMGWGEDNKKQLIEGKRRKDKSELKISCEGTEIWYIIYTAGHFCDNYIQNTVSEETTGVLTKLIEPQVLHIKGLLPPIGRFHPL